MRASQLPVAIDDPNMIFLWKESEVFPFVLICMIGLIADHLALSILIALGYTSLVRKLTTNKPRNFFKHWLWFRGLLPLTSATLPNPFIRRLY